MQEDYHVVTEDLKQEKEIRIQQEQIAERSNRWFYFNGTRWGIFAGLGMTLFLVGLQLLSFNDVVALKFAKYIFLAIFVMHGLSSQKTFMGKYYRFQDGMMMGGWITLISAATLAAMNLLLFAWTDTLAFDKFTETGTNLADTLTISGVLFFETLVFGMILTFIWMQFIKPKRGQQGPVR